MSVFTANAPELFRRATVQVPKIGSDGSRSSLRDSTLIPDYVVNYIRGETPETVARRKRNGGNQGARNVDIIHQHRPQQSHMVLLEGVQENRARRAHDAMSQITASSTMTELQMILPSTNEKPRKRRRLMTGWRLGVVLNALLAFVILVISFVCLVYAGTAIAILVGDMDLFTGSCADVTSLDWRLHALINVLVVILIVGANYVFQVLSSPTRSEIAGAHEGKRWLEIGVPSLRNFRHIGKGRVVLASILLTVAVVTQVIYNSVIFTTQAGLSYNLIAVTESFLTGSTFSNGTDNNAGGLSRNELLALQSLASRNGLTNLTTSECVDLFSGVFNTDFQNVLLVVNSSDSGNSLVETAQAGINLQSGNNMSTTISNAEIFFDGALVRYCLAQRSEAAQETCTLQLNGILLVVVVGLNLVTLVLTAAILILRRFEPLVTLGDAISSFLRDPDPSTRKNCLLSKKNLRTGMGGWGFTDGKYWAPERDHFWFRSPSLPNWLGVAFWWLACVFFAAGVLALTVASQPSSHPLSPFGVASPHTTYLLPAAAASSIAAGSLAIVTALPQILLAGLYFATNTLLTAYFLSRESSLHAVLATNARRPLRVSSDPEGHQTTSLYMTLPRPVSWALAVFFAAMGFVLSQACFVVSLTASTSPDPSDPDASPQHLLGVGFSGAALAVLLAMLVLLFLAVAGTGFLRAPAVVLADGRTVGNPLVFEGGSCSAVVSARCHRVPHEVDVYKQPVSWGVVAETPGASVSHATYSARPLGELDATRRYA
ncbi:hypothetical protein UCDDA912_g00017 [Diaporthe ampelina]|uniref:DUF6536 domain-containing protein n=1 Tax=Diaporthe ampelina TaxID=1214573 RepID=A0A0G2HZB5_9PEZI|nr:hypothetical protein UCDDA912_g00017 [Diaporthe ampelina]